MKRRTFLQGLFASAGATALAGTANLATTVEAAAHRGPIAHKWLPQRVRFSGYTPGTIIVDARRRFLYLVESRRYARRYGIGVGREGLAFTGTGTIARKAKWPRWTPTRSMIEREPEKYAPHAGGMPGGPDNPLGSRALYLYRDGRDTLYRIHGTNQPRTIGHAVSNGCIRMLNEHVADLYARVPIGTRVVVL